MRNKRVRPVVRRPPSETKTICHGAPPLIGTRDCRRPRAIAMRIREKKEDWKGGGSRVPHSRIHTYLIYIYIWFYAVYIRIYVTLCRIKGIPLWISRFYISNFPTPFDGEIVKRDNRKRYYAETRGMEK